MSVIGLRIGPFEIVEETSVPDEGRWYAVRRTAHARRGVTEALARLPDADASNASDARATLQQEFETLKRLDDPRIPVPVGFYEGSGALIVTASPGIPLSALVEQRRENRAPLQPATLLDLGIDLAEALQHAHNRGLVHGHLWPGRISLSEDGRLWVWGLGRTPAPTPPLAWLPPERARNEPISLATDEWSFGACLVALVTGRAPWRDAGDSVDSRLGNVEAAIEPVESQWPAFGRLLRRLMAPSPADRFPSFAPVRQELLVLTRKAGGTSARRELAITLCRGLPRGPEPLDVPPVQNATTIEKEPPPQPADPTTVDPPLPTESSFDEASASTEALVSTPVFETPEVFDAPTVRLDESDAPLPPPLPAGVELSTAPTAVPDEVTPPQPVEPPRAPEEAPSSPEIGDLVVVEPLPETEDSRITRVAPWAAVAMILALAALSIWRWM